MMGVRGNRAKLILAMAFVAAMAGRASAQGSGKQLSVERIYGQPSLAGRLTRGLAWSPDGKTLSFFELKGAGKQSRMSLMALDTATGQRRELVPAEKLESVLPEKKGPASQATGLGRRAPAQYEWSPDSSALLFVGADSLGWLDLKSGTAKTLVTGKEELADIKISPNGKIVSFVRSHNLFAVDVASGKERALTTGGKEELRKGELDWVYPEELEITTAYWWAPDSSRVAYLEMNEKDVNQFPMVDFASPAGEADLERYPVAGGKNPVVHVYTVSASGGTPKLIETGAENDIYLPRVSWLTDSKRIAIERLNRGQDKLELLIANAASGTSNVVVTQTDKYWVNLSDDLHFLKDGKRFLWSSEKSGYRHLYLYDLTGKELSRVTTGDWEVTGVDAVDEAHGLIYFTATEKSPMERQVYRIGFDGSGMTRISKEEGVHGAKFSPDASMYYDTHSSAGLPARQDLLRADGTPITAINENKVAELAEYHLTPLEFVKVKASDGTELNASMIRPPNFDPSKKYPVLVMTYGGPHAQVVMNQFGGANFLWHEYMAQKGFVVFSLDNRGSAGRGHLFETPIYRHLGEKELSDQHDGAIWLKSQPWVDPERIGIWGWSYGGHMTLHLMFEDGANFKAGFAGGPVTDWRYYDSIYTERYMGLPKDNEENYKKCSPVAHVDTFTGKLLIAHGTGDDNVHFTNTLAVINELIDQGKYVEVMPFPGRGHGVSDAPARIVLMNRVASFFVEHLGTAEKK